MENPIPESRASTSLNKRRQQTADGRQQNNLVWLDGLIRGLRVCGLWSVVCLSLLSGCGPKYTYPADTVPKSIEKICKEEYKIDVTARVVGKTVGALVYIDSIMDPKGQVPREVNEVMGKVLMVVTRVALSTDLPVEYCTVLIRDKEHSSELVIIRSLDDTKRANADAIGIEESINRTLLGQAKFETSPTGEHPFVLKEVRKENFLADQMVQRIRLDFSKDAKDDADRSLVLVDGAFENIDGKRAFRFSVIALKAMDSRELILSIFKVINGVLAGYQFTEFGTVEIQDYLNRQKLVLDRQTVLDFQTKKISEAQLLDRFLIESQSIQEAFKLFGFNLPPDSNDQDTGLAAKPTP